MQRVAKLVFAGTPEFALPALQALLQAGYDLAAVLTQPDRQAGRGRRGQQRALRPSPVKHYALAHQLPLLQPTTLRDAAIQRQLRTLAADLMIVVAYGLLLPKEVLAIPRLGCINVHASLLPRWRGAAPIQRALLAGDKESGVSIMALAEGLDSGPVFSQRRCPITASMTAGELHDQLATLGAAALLDSLPGIVDGTLHAEPQRTEGVTYAAKLSKTEAELDWQQSAQQLDRCIRAYNPWPLAYTFVGGERLLIHNAQPILPSPALAPETLPGRVIAEDSAGITVNTGAGLLRITTLQLAGRRAQPAADFIKAHSLSGVTLGRVT